MPPTGELLAMIGVRHTGGFRLYADGRLIHIWSFTEQRLTPEGVERVRSRFLSSGLFDSAQPLSDVADCPGPVTACVRDGDHWLGVAVDNADPGPSTAPPEAVRLYDDLRTLDATLPATAWIDPQHKPYVPARIATCFTMFANRTPVPIDLSALVSRFPEQAAGVLAAHEPSAEMQRVMAPLIDHEVGCFELTRDEARTLADAFLAPSGGGAHEYWGIVLRFGRQPDPAQPGATREEGAYIRFEQLLPDNVPVGSFGD
jgi:hypothetical protein